MANEIRVLEDQLYDADYQNRVLKDELQRVKAACETEGNTQVDLPSVPNYETPSLPYGPPIENAPLNDVPMPPPIIQDGSMMNSQPYPNEPYPNEPYSSQSITAPEYAPIESGPSDAIVDEMAPRSAPRVAPYGPVTERTGSENTNSPENVPAGTGKREADSSAKSGETPAPLRDTPLKDTQSDPRASKNLFDNLPAPKFQPHQRGRTSRPQRLKSARA